MSRSRTRVRSARRLLCSLAVTAFVVACGGRSPLDVPDGGLAAGFEPDAVVADDGGLGDEPPQSPPLDLSLPGLSPADASALCYLCEPNAPGSSPTATEDASPAPAQTTAQGAGYSIQNGECSSSVEATGDGGSYQVLCSCPEGACVCFGPTTTTVVPFTGCPLSCPDGVAAISLCGFGPLGL